ncbi:YihY/virulence factor BrkB family protein [Desulfopila aestuarii]|uniref:Membrane protein n=1 Tax=Desulfopila aestuarii DSM 18488 TaxID=1121416 RepID=A0A1M7XZP4_9BACT|nr:YihY/virulence factor BrkB family protein [Desulfopila aestuarii]SHO44648.1 membrane protein [Desulfopila aestuarii DSM 18488]
MHAIPKQLNPLPGKLLRWANDPVPANNIVFRLLHDLVRLLLITYREMNKNELTLRSAALTYTILLSLVPVLAMSTAVVKGLGGSNQLREVAYTYIATLEESGSPMDMTNQQSGVTESPATAEKQKPSGLTAHLRGAIDQLFDYVDKTNFATLGSFGVAGIFVSVILVFGNIELALNAIWNVQKSRSIMRKIADYLMLIVLMPISINVALAAGAFLTSPTLASHFQLLIPFVWLQTLVLKLVPISAIALTFYVIYIFFPNTKVHTIPALSGAIFAAILWFGVQNTYIRLQIGVSNYNAIYGSFATLPLFLVWMYLGWLFVLAGAQVAYACQNLKSYRLLPVPAEPASRLSAAMDIMEKVQIAHAQSQPLTREDLESLQEEYGSVLVEEVTDELVAAELLHISNSTGCLLPAGPAEVLGHGPVIKAIFGTETPNTPGGAATREVLSQAIHLSTGVQTQGGQKSGPGNLQEEQSST